MLIKVGNISRGLQRNDVGTIKKHSFIRNRPWTNNSIGRETSAKVGGVSCSDGSSPS